MITHVGCRTPSTCPPPSRFEAGTQRVSQAVAFAAAVRYLQHLGMENVEAWEHELGARLVEGVQKIEGRAPAGPDRSPSARAWWPSPLTVCTRTTWASCSIRRVSLCAWVTTARSRCTAAPA